MTLPWRVILATCWKGDASVPTWRHKKSGVGSKVLQLVTVIRKERVRGRYRYKHKKLVRKLLQFSALISTSTHKLISILLNTLHVVISAFIEASCREKCVCMLTNLQFPVVDEDVLCLETQILLVFKDECSFNQDQVQNRWTDIQEHRLSLLNVHRITKLW